MPPMRIGILATSNTASPFAWHGADVSAEVIAYQRALGLDALVTIGGDGTMTMAARLGAAGGVPMVGVPKTIDNDIAGCERSFGFDTAVATVTDALERVQTTGQSHGRVMVVETMGRYAGWIALESGIAGAADVILLPEIGYDVARIAEVCCKRARGGPCAAGRGADAVRPRAGGRSTATRRRGCCGVGTSGGW